MLDKPVKLTITINPNKLEGVEKESIRLYVWHEEKDKNNPEYRGYWDRTPDTTYDFTHNRIEATLNHFSLYAVRAPVEEVLTPEQKAQLEKDLKEMLKTAKQDEQGVGIVIDIEETLVTVSPNGSIELAYAPYQKRTETIQETKTAGNVTIEDTEVTTDAQGNVQTGVSHEYFSSRGCHADIRDGWRIQVRRFDLQRTTTVNGVSSSQEYVLKLAVHTNFDKGEEAMLAGSVTEKSKKEPLGGAKITALNQKTDKRYFTFTKLDGSYILPVQSGLYTLLASKEGCSEAKRTDNLVCAHGQWHEDETLYYDKTKGYTSNYILDCQYKPPKIQSFSYTQLHKNYDESPHRYVLSVVAKDPQNQKLKYSWQITCGYFVVDPDTKRQFADYDKQRLAVGPLSSAEWRYDTPGECENAIVTIVAHNEVFKEDVLKRSVF